MNSSDIRETQSEKTSEQMSRQNAVRQCRRSENIYGCCDEVQIRDIAIRKYVMIVQKDSEKR